MTTADRRAKVPERIVNNCKAIVEERERSPSQFALFDIHIVTIRPVRVYPLFKVLTPRCRVVFGLPRQEPDFFGCTVAVESTSKRMYADRIKVRVQD